MHQQAALAVPSKRNAIPLAPAAFQFLNANFSFSLFPQLRGEGDCPHCKQTENPRLLRNVWDDRRCSFQSFSNLPLRSLFFDRGTVACRNAHKSRQTRRSLTRISQEKKGKETTSHSIIPFLSSPKSFTRISLHSRVEPSWLRFFCLSLSLCVFLRFGIQGAVVGSSFPFQAPPSVRLGRRWEENEANFPRFHKEASPPPSFSPHSPLLRLLLLCWLLLEAYGKGCTRISRVLETN